MMFNSRVLLFPHASQQTLIPLDEKDMINTNKMKCLVALALCLSASLTSAAGPASYGIHFPKAFLKPGERIDEIVMKVSCGHIEAITHIPDDWNMEVIRAISAVEELKASAGHGGSMLEKVEEINGAIRVSVGEKACFKVSIELLIHKGPGEERVISLPQSRLKLLP